LAGEKSCYANIYFSHELVTDLFYYGKVSGAFLVISFFFSGRHKGAMGIETFLIGLVSVLDLWGRILIRKN
jgi:hypothetical protein